MIETQPIGMSNTGIPLAMLAAGAVVLPWVIAPKGTLSQRRLALAVAITAAVLIVLGAGIFAAVYALAGVAVSDALAVGPLTVLEFFLRLSLKAALFWGPVLALAWYVMAQGVERRRGEDIARRSEP